jgi:alpha-ribazole phosphatase
VSLLWLWRHPRVASTEGWCIGRTDRPLDPRRAKRLAHRLRRTARRHRLPRRVFTSPLARCRSVGRWLARWGWEHRVDERLQELDFGSWDGRRWSDIPVAELDAWCADLVGHAPGDGEALADLLLRVQSFCHDAPDHALVVTHAGWMQALQLLRAAGGLAVGAVKAADWPAPPPHGFLVRIARVAGTPAPTIRDHPVDGVPPLDHAGGAVPSCPDSMSSPSGSNASCSGTRN